MANRVKELDYLKCVFIVLMIVFHLVYISEKYPHIKSMVYTFHMSSFLIISGYLMNIRKKTSLFFRDMFWIFIPYLVMEVSYILMSSILPIRETVHNITPVMVIYRAFLAPMGPYWYLHTLILCSIVYFIVYRYFPTDNFSRLIILGLSYFVLSYMFNLILFDNAIYFSIGIIISKNRQGFISIFRPSGLAIVPLVVLCSFPNNLSRGTLAGIAITYLCISLLLYIHKYLKEGARRFFYTIGQNTFVILLFSPIFTIISKKFIPFFAFDPSGLSFAVVAVVFVISGCALIALIIDRLHLTKIFFGKKQLLMFDDFNYNSESKFRK